MRDLQSVEGEGSRRRPMEENVLGSLRGIGEGDKGLDGRGWDDPIGAERSYRIRRALWWGKGGKRE